MNNSKYDKEFWGEIFRTFISFIVKMAFPVLLLLVILSVSLNYVLDDSGGGFWKYVLTPANYGGVISGLLINLISAVAIFLLFRIIYDWLFAKTEEEKQENYFDKMGSIFQQKVSGILSVKAITSFDESFYDIDWTDKLKGATELNLVAVFWSPGWVRDNLPKILEIGSLEKIKIHLSNPLSFRSEYSTDLVHKPAIRRKIFKCAINCSKDNARIEVLFVDKIPPYMYAHIKKEHGDEFLFSPYQMSEEVKGGRPPAVTVSLHETGGSFVTFVNGELEALKNNLVSFDGLNIQEYIHWSEDNKRVVVSLAIGCNAGCKFCYVPSLVDEEKNRKCDPKILAHAIAQSLVYDPKFKLGVDGTTIFLGGMTDPFLKNNEVACLAFFDAIEELEVSNILHIATRFEIFDSLLPKINGKHNITVSFSISHFDKAKARESSNHSKRLGSNPSIRSQGNFSSLYLRPIIPEVTLRDIDSIIAMAHKCEFSEVIIGNFFVDNNIYKKSELGVLPKKSEAFIQGKMILDKAGKLRRLDQNDTRRKITTRLENEGFRVFENASGFTNWVREQIAKTGAD